MDTASKNKPANEPAASVSDQLLPGKLFAYFELQRELYIGSTGPVWLAQNYSVGRQADLVALKFLPDFVANDKTAVDELKNQIQRRIPRTHPNILRVYGLVEHKGRVAIQMEYVDGQSLSGLRLTKPNQMFEIRDLEKWAKQLCEALECAHKDGGPIAGDFVPGNLIVDSAGDLKLEDLGIANCTSDSMRRLTVSGKTRETLPYMSPQRAAGEKPTIADDLYSLGAILYELLTGNPPFSQEENGFQAAARLPLSMTERRTALGIDGEEIPRSWEETVAACLAKDALQRPQSAIEVEKRLKTTTKPVTEPPPPVRSSPGRKRPPVIAGILFILVLASAIAFFAFRHPAAATRGQTGVTATPGKTNANLDETSRVKTPRVIENVFAAGRSAEDENSLPSATTSPVGKSTLTPEVSPTPESSPTPSPEMSPIPSPEASPAPSPEVSPSPSSEVGPAPTPEASPLPSTEARLTPPGSSPTPSTQEAALQNGREPADSSATPLNQHDVDATREEVIKRINLLPGITAEKRANLIEKMHKARSMERLAVIPFDSGRTTLKRAAADQVVQAFDTPAMHDKLSDPTIILVVAGYADTGGRADQNLRISKERAENVSRVLKEQAQLLNAMQTIGMGGTELLDSNRPDQNRVVEVWAVVPL
jgi:serine/threonine protein kinase